MNPKCLFYDANIPVTQSVEPFGDATSAIIRTANFVLIDTQVLVGCTQVVLHCIDVGVRLAAFCFIVSVTAMIQINALSDARTGRHEQP